MTTMHRADPVPPAALRGPSPTVRPPAALALAALALAGCASGGGRVSPTSPADDATPITAPAEAPATLAERRAPEPANVAYDPSLFSDLDWDWIGPARGGRVTTVTGVEGRPGTYWIGSTGGGVWRTTDYGESWHPMTDGWLETGSIGAVRVAPSDPDVVWVATGSDGLRSNVITGLGVYRSTDGGESWRFLGLRDIGNTGALEVHPTDPDVAYVAAIGHPFGPNPERGLYRTRDGGTSWERVLFVSDSTGIVDVEIDPRDPRVLYAASWRAERKPWTIISGAREGGVYKSTDGGDTWTELAGGLPTGEGALFGKIDLAVSRSSPDVVYALIEAPEPDDGLYRSDDAGASWTQVSSERELLARPFYYTNVDVDPTDPDVVWVDNEGLWRSTDGGRRWSRVRTPHGDNHDIWIDPADPDLMVQGNDGGANVSRDGGRSWSSQLNQPTAELYSVDLSDDVPYWAYSGQQDRSAVGVASGPTATGEREVSLGCETGPAVPKPGSPGVVYNSCKGRFMVWDRGTGENRNYWVGAVYMYGHAARDLPYRMQRVSPIEVSPHDPDVVYYGTQYVMRTADGGRSWERISPDLTATPPGTQGVSGEPITRDITGEEVYSTLYAIEESPVAPGVIWAGAYDGPFHVTRDGGASWTDVTPPGLEPGGRVQSIDPSPFEPGTAIFSVLRFMFDDWRPLAWRTRDYGASWELLTTGENGIPADYPVRVVVEDPRRQGLLYAGTEFGIYVSFDDGARWQPLQLDLPAVPVTDMAFRDDDLVISTMGRGFWVLRDRTPLRALDAAVAAAPAHLYDPGVAVRRPGGGGYGWGGNAGPVTPEDPEPGTAVDWVLDAAPAGAITVELLDADGAVLNGWSSDDAGYRMATTHGMRAERTVRVGGPRVPKRAGHTRFAMPLEHTGPWSEARRGEPEGLTARGPRVAPGEYRVRVRAGDWVEERPLTVTMDPRVADAGVTAADLRAQEALALRVRDLLGRARRAAARVAAELEKTEAASRRSGAEGAESARVAGERRRRLEALRAELTAEEGISYPQPMLVEQLGYLYGMITDADQDPGRDAGERADALEAEVERIEAAVDRALEDA